MNAAASSGRSRNIYYVVVAVYALLVLQAMFGSMDLHVFDQSPGIDRLLAFKLMLSTAVAVVTSYGLIYHPRIWKTLTTVPTLLVVGILACTVVGSFSQVNSSSLPSSLINCLNLIFVIFALRVVGVRRFSQAIVLGAIGIAVYALYLYYFVPERGVFMEPISMTQSIARMGGVGHPNGAARAFVIGILLSLYLYRTRANGFWLTLPIVVLFVSCLILTKSRTGMVAGLIGLLLLYSDRINWKWIATTAVIGGISGLIGAMTLFAIGEEDRLFGRLIKLVSKSDDRDELLTATGRTDIWAASLELIQQRPLTGFGLNASPVLLIDYAQSTHNAVLYAWMSGGIFAGLMMIALQIRLAWNMFASSSLLIRGLSGYLWVSCLIEDTVLESIPGPATLVFFACCVIPTKASMFQITVYLRRWRITTTVVGPTTVQAINQQASLVVL